jgi:hypothetical protein
METVNAFKGDLPPEGVRDLTVVNSASMIAGA